MVDVSCAAAGVATPSAQSKNKACIVTASNLGLKTRRGVVFEGVNIKLHAGEVCALRGHNGTGKTALLLCLAGHMIPSEGSLQVAGFTLPRERHQVQKISGKAIFAGLNDLQESLTVKGVLGAEFELFGRKPKHEALMEYLRAWNLADVASLQVKDLTSKKKVRLGVALACVGNPKLLVVDDIEDQLTKSQAEDLMTMLITIARQTQTCVVVGVIERDLAQMADCAWYLESEGK